MARTKSTLFNPIMGSRYYIEVIKTKELVEGYVPPFSEKKYGKLRSGKICEKGKEFFKVVIDGTAYKFLNSIQFGECYSECKKYRFTNDKFKKDKKDSPKRTFKKKEKVPIKSSVIEFYSEEALNKIMKGIK